MRLPLGGAAGSFVSAGANCICVHGEKDEIVRQEIQQDLTGRHLAAGSAS